MAISKYGNYIGKPKKGVKKITLSLKTELLEELEQYSKDNDIMRSHIIEELIETYLANHKPQRVHRYEKTTVNNKSSKGSK